jgi:hypothetical protein
MMRGPKFRNWTRHSRRAALWLAGFFAVSQIALAVVIDQNAPAIRDPEYVLLQDMLRDRIAEKPGKPVAMFLGSSRVALGSGGITTRSSSISASPAPDRICRRSCSIGSTRRTST